MNVGMGGADVNLGTIAQSLAGLVAWRVNMDLWTSKEAEAHRYTSSLRTLYSDGGIVDFTRSFAGATSYYRSFVNPSNWSNGNQLEY